MKEIKSDTKSWEAAISAAQDLNPIHWVSESRDIAKAATYTDEVLNPIKAAQRSGTDKVETISLSDDYLKAAGKVAQQRVAVAAHRLAAVWRMCLKADAAAAEKDANKKVRVWFCPSKEPSRVIADELNSANTTIDVAIYSFSDKAIRKVLAEAAKRGVTIRLILNQANKHKSLADALEDAGIDVRYVSQTMHHKFCVVDGQVLLTGSMNWSTQSYARYDEDLVKFQKSPEVVSAFQTEFEYIWMNSKDYGQEIHGVKSVPLRWKVADIHFTSANMTPSQYRGLPTFTASDALEDGVCVCGRRLIQSIGNARKSILVATTHFRRSDIADALRNALARGVRVELLLDMQEYHKPDTEMSQSRFDERLAEIGANVKYKVYAKEWAYQTALQMHTKFAIIDGTEVLTGSFNYSKNSELNSFENLVSIRDPHAVAAYTKPNGFE